MKRKTGFIVINMIYYLALSMLVLMLILPHTKLYYNVSIWNSFDKRANTRTVYLPVGKCYQIALFKMNRIAEYKSSDFKVASVTGTGFVTTFHPGKAIVTIKQKERTYSYRFYVIKLSKKKLKMKKSRIRKLFVRGVHFGVRWESTNYKIVSVNRFGWVKAKKKGTAYIVARVGDQKLRCKICVK